MIMIPAASAQTVLKASDVHPAGYPNVVAVENLGKKLEAATNGRYKLQMFPGGVLGSEKEVVDMDQRLANWDLSLDEPLKNDSNTERIEFINVDIQFFYLSV